MNFRTSRILMWVGFAIGILLGGFGFAKDSAIFYVIATIIILLSVVQAFIFYKCPYCNYCLMDVRGDIPHYCPECGGKLRENN